MHLDLVRFADFLKGLNPLNRFSRVSEFFWATSMSELLSGRIRLRTHMHVNTIRDGYTVRGSLHIQRFSTDEVAVK